MNRAQRRAAERQVKKKPAPTRGSAPAETSPCAPSPTPARPVAPSPEYDALLRELDVPADGIGPSLLPLTDAFARLRRFSTSTNYHVRDAERRATFPQWSTPDMAGIVQRRARAERARWGSADVFCEHGLCGRMESACVKAETMPSIRRCTQCLQVYYCNAKCQKDDWPRHRLYCETAAAHPPQKDAFIQILRSVFTNHFFMPFLKSYMRSALNADTDPFAIASRHLLVICTLLPCPVRKARLMLQVSEVMLTPPLREPPSGGIVDVATARARLLSGQCEPRFPVSLLWDIPGLSTRQWVMTGLEREVFQSAVLPQPVFALAALNQLIRDDIDNVFKLRVPSSWVPPFEKWQELRDAYSEAHPLPDVPLPECYLKSERDVVKENHQSVLPS